MTEYVEKAAILSKCEEMWNNADETTQTGVDTINAIDRITDYIESLPTTDVQPVVRCKDCKYRIEHHYEDIGEPPYIKYECKFTKYSMSDEGFCSFGAKKTLTGHTTTTTKISKEAEL